MLLLLGGDSAGRSMPIIKRCLSPVISRHFLSVSETMPPKSQPKRKVKKGDEAACIRGIHKHRGRSVEDATKICKANRQLQANKRAKKG